MEEIFMEHDIENWKGAVQIFFKESVKLMEDHYKDEIILKDRVYTHKSILSDYDEKLVNKFNNTLRHANNLIRKNQWEKLF